MSFLDAIPRHYPHHQEQRDRLRDGRRGSSQRPVYSADRDYDIFASKGILLGPRPSPVPEHCDHDFRGSVPYLWECVRRLQLDGPGLLKHDRTFDKQILQTLCATSAAEFRHSGLLSNTSLLLQQYAARTERQKQTFPSANLPRASRHKQACPKHANGPDHQIPGRPQYGQFPRAEILAAARGPTVGDVHCLRARGQLHPDFWARR